MKRRVTGVRGYLIHNHFLVFSVCHIKMQMVLLTPCDQVVHHSLMLFFITLCDT